MCNLYDPQSVFRFSLCLHYHTSCSYRVPKVVLTSFKQNYSRISCSSSIHGTNFREKQVKEMEKKEESVGNLDLKEEKFYEILQAEMRLQDECNCKILFANDFWKL